MLRIQRLGSDGAVYILSGRMDAGQAAELDKLLLEEPAGTRIVVDLKDLTLVDRETVRLLERCEVRGVKLRNSPAYIRVWIDTERCYADLYRENRNLPDTSRNE